MNPLIQYVNMNHRHNFDEICRMLRAGEPFTYSRFGDGEFNAILGAPGQNCDGHIYYPDMGAELGKILKSKPPYLVGIHHGAVLGAETLEWLEENDAMQPFIWSGIFHDALKYGWMPEFFDALAHRDILIVGPDHLRGIKDRIWYQHFIQIPARNCWTATNSVLPRIEKWIEPEFNCVVLFCASMAANVWIDRLYQQFGSDTTLIDLGSGIDPYCGVVQRSYHKKAVL